MTLVEAIKTALQYEVKVRDTYMNAAEKAVDATAKRVFKTLGDEEQGHVAYLESRLAEWNKTGHVMAAELGTVIPSRVAIEEGVRRLEGRMSSPDIGTELQMFSKALQLETETSSFYRRMVSEVKDHAELFGRFLETSDIARLKFALGYMLAVDFDHRVGR